MAQLDSQAFLQKQKAAYLQHNKITQNTITPELEKATCHEILQHTEKVLCSSPDPPSQLKKIYTAFLQEINASTHVPCPELKEKLEDTPVTTIQREEKNIRYE